MANHVYDNLLKTLINYYGEIKIPHGSCKEEVWRIWKDNFSMYRAKALVSNAHRYIAQDKYNRFPSVGALKEFFTGLAEKL